MMKKLFVLLMPLLALTGCTSDEEAACPVLNVEGGQIQGVQWSGSTLPSWASWKTFACP